jgi:3-deoxy-D-manno-octulosonate 8-phosphate phosphatase (KDO 8-P phosphatase)
VIELLALDVDGVLTTGEILLDEEGRESKTLYFRDIDAVFAARRAGLTVALVSGESGPMLDVIARRLEIDLVRGGCKDKLAAVEELASLNGVALSQVCFVGDSLRDAAALEAVGLGVAPEDASLEARNAADLVVRARGGRGAVEQTVAQLLSQRPAD